MRPFRFFQTFGQEDGFQVLAVVERIFAYACYTFGNAHLLKAALLKSALSARNLRCQRGKPRVADSADFPPISQIMPAEKPLISIIHDITTQNWPAESGTTRPGSVACPGTPRLIPRGHEPGFLDAAVRPLFFVRR